MYIFLHTILHVYYIINVVHLIVNDPIDQGLHEVLGGWIEGKLENLKWLPSLP